jgi:hypothetical protein
MDEVVKSWGNIVRVVERDWSRTRRAKQAGRSHDAGLVIHAGRLLRQRESFQGHDPPGPPATA